MKREAKPRPPAAQSEELGERRRRELLAAAYGLIAEKGLEGLRTRDIAARAGVNISTLHYYFGTKEALLEAVVQYLSEKFTEPLEGAAAAAADPSTLRHHFEQAGATFRKNPELAIVLQELALRALRDAATRTAMRALFKYWNMQVEAVLDTGVRAGTLREDLDPHDAAYAVTSYIMGAMTQLGVNAKAFDFNGLSRQLEGWLAR